MIDGFKTITDKILYKLDKNIDEMRIRTKNIEGWQANQDLAIEPEVTNGIKDLVKEYATKNGYRFTYKTGKNYPANLREPTNSKRLIINIDGSYLVTNDEKNSKVENNDYPKNAQHEIIEQNVQNAMKILKKGERSGYIDPLSNSMKAIKTLKNAERKIISEVEYKKALETHRETLLKVKEKLQQKDISIRELFIVEAKSFLKKEYVEAQAEKMMNLIDYFSKVYLYYESEKDGRFKEVKEHENWTIQFIELCKQYNMKFTGLILILGGPSGIKNIYNEFTQMKGNFKRLLAQNIIGIKEKLNTIESSYIKYKLEKEYEFKLLIHTDFFLVTPGSYRFSEEL